MTERAHSMEFKQLHTFVALAEVLHFGQAAEKLRIAQPHVSRRIKQLEEELDVLLFYRDKRNVKLTEAGEVFLVEARTLLKDAAMAREHVRESALGRRGRLRVGVMSSAMLGVVPSVLGTFHRRHPNVYLDFKELIQPIHIDALSEGTIDIALSHPPLRVVSDYAQLPLERAPLVAVLPRNHRLAGLGRIDLDELATEPWVMFPRENGSPTYDRIIALCERVGFSPNIVQQARPVQTRLALVAAGFGVCLVHRTWENVPFPGLVYVPIEPTAMIGLSCFWRKDDPNPILGQFIEIVDQHRL